MTHDISQNSCDTLVDASSPFLDQLDTLNDVIAIVDSPASREEDSLQLADSSVENASEDAAKDDAEWVLSSELIEPLMASDMVDLDYDEDVPTRIDASPRRARSESPPARIDTRDVFYLSDQKRPSLVLVDEERVDIAEVVRAEPRIPKVVLPNVVAPPVRDTVPPSLHAREMSSIAPMAMPSATAIASGTKTGKRHPRYGATILALAAVAATLALWPSGSTSAPDEEAKPIAAHGGPAEKPQVATEPRIQQLDVVSIIGATRTDAPTTTQGKKLPAWKPSQEVVIDDTAQLTGEVVFPSEPVSEVAAPRIDSVVPEPTIQEAPLPFDPSAATSAMNATASAAQSCREQGVPRWPARVSVTFAPTGHVTTATVDGSQISGTAVGGCIARKFRAARVKPFEGAPVTVHKTFLF